MRIPATVTLAFVFIHNASAVSIYTDESAYLAALAALPSANVFTESFEDDTAWAESRRTVTSGPGPTASISSNGVLWTSNYAANEIATGPGPAIFGNWGFFSLPHGNATDSSISICDATDEPAPDSTCWQNDGWTVTAENGETLYGVGGWLDTNTGGGAKVTILLDGVDVNANDTDNPGNINRDGFRLALFGAVFVGVIDENGFTSAEFRELAGKDSQQEYIYGDKFTIGTSGPVTVVPLPAAAWLIGGAIAGLAPLARRRRQA